MNYSLELRTWQKHYAKFQNDIMILAIFSYLYSIVAGRNKRGMVSGPIIFVSADILMGALLPVWFEGAILRHQLRIFADMTLVLILFSDDANVELSVLRSKLKIPARMLLVGLPGVIGLDSELPGGEVIALVVIQTVFLSLFIHGITARPLSAWISR